MRGEEDTEEMKNQVAAGSSMEMQMSASPEEQSDLVVADEGFLGKQDYEYMDLLNDFNVLEEFSNEEFGV